MVGASALRADPITNKDNPTRNSRRRPRASPARPAGMSSMPKESAYPEMTHCRWVLSVRSPDWIEGNATLMTDTDTRAMNSGVMRTASMRRG